MQKISMKHWGLRLSRSPEACFVQCESGDKKYSIYLQRIRPRPRLM